MAKRRQKKMTEVERVRKLLEERGFKPVSEQEKKESWYRQHVEQLERWRREELGKPFTVKERDALYSSKKSKPTKARA